MTALHDDIVFYAGETWYIDGVLRGADGIPLNLSGAGVRWRCEAPGAEPLFDYSIDDGITVVDAAAGTILIKVPAERSALATPGVYRDQLQVTIGDEVSTQWIGSIVVRKSLFA